MLQGAEEKQKEKAAGRERRGGASWREAASAILETITKELEVSYTALSRKPLLEYPAAARKKRQEDIGQS